MTLSTQLMKHQNGSHSCPPQCRVILVVTVQQFESLDGASHGPWWNISFILRDYDRWTFFFCLMISDSLNVLLLLNDFWLTYFRSCSQRQMLKCKMMVLQVWSNIVSRIKDGISVFVYCIQELVERVADVISILGLLYDFIFFFFFFCNKQC